MAQVREILLPPASAGQIVFNTKLFRQTKESLFVCRLTELRLFPDPMQVVEKYTPGCIFCNLFSV